VVVRDGDEMLDQVGATPACAHLVAEDGEGRVA
jgi:hypothetical protein